MQPSAFLRDKVENSKNRLSESLTKLDGTVSSLHEASTISVSAKAKRTLEQGREATCQKMADRMDKEGARLLGRLSMRDRVIISTTAF